MLTWIISMTMLWLQREAHWWRKVWKSSGFTSVANGRPTVIPWTRHSWRTLSTEHGSASIFEQHVLLTAATSNKCNKLRIELKAHCLGARARWIYWVCLQWEAHFSQEVLPTAARAALGNGPFGTARRSNLRCSKYIMKIINSWKLKQKC